MAAFPSAPALRTLSVSVCPTDRKLISAERQQPSTLRAVAPEFPDRQLLAIHTHAHIFILRKYRVEVGHGKTISWEKWSCGKYSR